MAAPATSKLPESAESFVQDTSSIYREEQKIDRSCPNGGKGREWGRGEVGGDPLCKSGSGDDASNHRFFCGFVGKEGGRGGDLDEEMRHLMGNDC